MEKIVRLDGLSQSDAIRIEGNTSRFSESELESMLPSGVSSVNVKSSLARGELVVVSDKPAVPLFKYSDGKLVANASNQITVTDQAFNDAKQRFLMSKPRMSASRSASNDPSSSFSEPSYVPEPVIAEPPLTPTPPPVISENFSSAPQADKVFSKSCTRPFGDTNACDKKILAANFGWFAVFGAVGATTASGGQVLVPISGNTSRMPLNWSAAGKLLSQVASRANFIVMAFWPSQLGDGTIYGNEELYQLAEAVTRVRFRIYEDDNGNPQIVGIHTGEYDPYGDTVRIIKAKSDGGQNFVADVGEGLTITWFPEDDESAKLQLPGYPDESDFDISNIWVNPIDDDGQEVTSYINPIPDTDIVDSIFVFPADSGIPPLYAVFSKPVKAKVKPLEVGTYGDLAPRSKKDGLDIDHIPSLAALKRALMDELGVTFLTEDQINMLKNSAAGIAIPAKIHQKCSETYGGRNQPGKQIKDSNSIEDAIDSNFDAIERCLKDNGYEQEQLDAARKRLHEINKENGWY
ncbi:S-type pyocin domain-containing protein [Enterovibrio norvegicus]|uniref:S-type pyocin domain-containing protein n=1 Tax=Enterovibrio norvegicus TaxID=188144 RepID=UPI0002D3583A|nr:S-type pyocin domain-containing protein [Enterovibrio norvegicus]OEF57951.1 hypothetical protein A1OU_07020 [Enterovibrio norvegicus]